jgi:hypothetical protein
MTKHVRKATEIDSREMTVHFSVEVRESFRNLADAVKSSPHFDSGTRKTLQEWAAGKTPSVGALAVALPGIAEEAVAHVNATGDQRADEVWDKLKEQLQGRDVKPFTLTRRIVRGATDEGQGAEGSRSL